MRTIDTVADLEAIYGRPGMAAQVKVADRLVAQYRDWIGRARFCILSTVGPGGVDASPRGDDGPVVRLSSDTTILLPDWHGNNRVDSLRNIVEDGRVSLMFMVPGSRNVIRVNGRAVLTDDAAMCESFARGRRTPRSVAVVSVAEVYFQCARAILRADLWSGRDASAGLPTPGEMLAALSRGAEGGADYDAAWSDRAERTLW